MKVVLNQDIKGQGKKGQIVEVNDGYARNYLLPKKLASEASASAVNIVNQKTESEKLRAEKEKQAAISAAESLKGQTIEIKVKCGDGKIYGSVTGKEIADTLKARGFDIDKKQIVLKDAIRSLGEFDLEIKVFAGISVKIKLVVAKEG